MSSTAVIIGLGVIGIVILLIGYLKIKGKQKESKYTEEEKEFIQSCADSKDMRINTKKLDHNDS